MQRESTRREIKKYKAQNPEEKEESEVAKKGEEPRRCNNSRKGTEFRIIHGFININSNNDELVDIGSGEKVDKQNTKESKNLEL